MLPSESRVRRGAEFARAIRAGRRSGRTHLGAYLALADGSESSKSFDEARTGPARAGFVVGAAAGGADGERPAATPRVGFVVSKAVGNAVVRNRVRRRLRHLCAQRLDALPPGSVFVVRALPPAATADSALLGRELDAALKRLTGGGAARTAEVGGTGRAR